MGRNKSTSKLIDEILRYGVGGTAIVGALLVPGLAVALAKPMNVLFEHLDQNEKERQLMKTLYYLKQQGYLVGTYEHGLQLTDKARRRLATHPEPQQIRPQEVWDEWWRIVIYDIPEDKKIARQSIQQALKAFGFLPLQRSVYITPFPCLKEIQQLATARSVDDYVTYFKAKNLANEAAMLRLFKSKYPHTKF